MRLCGGSAPRRSSAWRDRCAISQLPRGVQAYVIGLVAVYGAVAVWLVSSVSPRPDDIVLATALLAAGALSVEATRRLGEPSGTVVKDLLSAWWLPMAVLLPPAYVLLAPAPLMALTQWRVRPTLVYRRVFSAAAIGLSYAAASAGFHAVMPDGAGVSEGRGVLVWAAVATAAGACAATLNALLVAVAVKSADPQTTWREVLWDTENIRLDGVEVCLGVTVGVLVAVEPALLVFTLPPIVLLQRGLVFAQLRSAAMLDGKTGLLNAASWEREAEGKLMALRRRGQPAAVLLIDIDHFKGVNDTYGHLVGDQILREVAATLASGVRDGDVLGRFGGEEFVALLPATDADETARVAERLRRQVAGLVVSLPDGAAVTVTVSVGAAATRSSDLSVVDLLSGADECLYRAKLAGRNRVVPRQVVPTS